MPLNYIHMAQFYALSFSQYQMDGGCEERMCSEFSFFNFHEMQLAIVQFEFPSKNHISKDIDGTDTERERERESAFTD